MLLGENGGREFLLGSEKLGDGYLGLLLPIGRGILTGAVPERIRVCIGFKFPLDKYVGGDGDGDGENGGES